MNGYTRSPTRYSSSPTGADRSSPISANAASCDGESRGLAGVDTFFLGDGRAARARIMTGSV
jgi:hypothetical protein